MQEQQYLDLLQHILDKGVQKGDRTGTGTISTFGYQMRFDLSAFPLLTTKKMFLKGIVHELLWIISGSTNIKYLQDNGVKIWNEWADEKGDLGPVYGYQWIHWGAKPKSIPQPIPKLRKGLKSTYLGVACGSKKENHVLKKTWEGMIARCYDKNNVGYHLYGGRGVHVCDRWLEFEAFAEDAEQLPGWEDKHKDSETRYVLDKDGRGDGFKYSFSFCQWITDEQNNQLQSNKIYTVEKDGKIHTFRNPAKFCREQGIDDRNFSDLWTGKKNAKSRYGFSLVDVKDTNVGINQIERLIKGIKENPNSRRHIVTAWNPSHIEYMKLPPCHCFMQFYVADGKLSCQLYQRSADVFLGVPFNIASYALLTMMVAQVCGLEPGEFVHTFGDVHIYNNHIEQVKLQLTRDPLPAPKMWINPGVTDIDDFVYEDFRIVGYEHHPAIKGEVSV